MRVNVISQSIHKSKKERHCGLSEFVGETEFPNNTLTFSEIRSLVVYQRNHRRIMPGDIYVRQFNEYEGDKYTWIAKKDIFDLLCKYNLFPGQE